MVRAEQLEAILARFPALRVCVLGDLFLDKYLDIDPELCETSLETGLEAHQVTRVRCYPGAAGTVASNLAALGLGRVALLSVIGDDGEGYDVRRAVRERGIDDSWLRVQPGFCTPTYTKPLLHAGGRPPRELNRLDIKNRRPLPAEAEAWALARLEAAAGAFDAIVIGDQVEERDCGVVTERVRAALAALAERRRGVVWVADSRRRIGEFRHVIIKPNRAEAAAALGCAAVVDVERAARELAARVGRPVYITLGEEGLLVADGRQAWRVPGYRVSGEVDIVGAGDSTIAGITAALCAGATLRQAGLIGCLAASITVQQLGVTGTATPAQLRRRFAEYVQQHPGELEEPDSSGTVA